MPRKRVSCCLLCFMFVFFGNLISIFPAQAVEMDMVLVLDRSGSMRGYPGHPPTDPEGLSAPAAAFILDQLSLMGDQNHAAIVTFSSSAQILGQKKPDPQGALTGNIPGLIEMLQAGSTEEDFTFRENAPDEPAMFHKLLQSQMKEQGQTELDLALRLARDILEQSDQETRKTIVLISDGFPEVNFRSSDRLEELGGVVGLKLINRFKKGQFSKGDIRAVNRAW